MNLIDMLVAKLLFWFYCVAFTGGHYGNPLNKYIRHYEGLSYDTDVLHSKHQRTRRAVSHEDSFLHLDFHAHGRHFNLRMKRDTKLFAPDFKLEMAGEYPNYDTSHIYSGEVYGEPGSLSHGSIVDGKFEGFIKTYHGTYYVEPSERYLKDRDVPFHSVIYHENDIGACYSQVSSCKIGTTSLNDKMGCFAVPINFQLLFLGYVPSISLWSLSSLQEQIFLRVVRS